jgi:hypothetical protein
VVIWISYFRSCKMVNHPSMRHNIAGYLWHVGMKYQWFSLWTGFDPHVRTHSCWWLNEIHVTSCYYHMTGKKTFVNLESWDEATRTMWSHVAPGFAQILCLLSPRTGAVRTDDASRCVCPVGLRMPEAPGWWKRWRICMAYLGIVEGRGYVDG